MRLGRMITVTALSAATAMFAAMAPAQDAIQAGVSAAVRGDVQIARADAVGRQVNSGEAIFLQDAIESGADSGMQILLLDETVFTIGPESEISIDEFVYDPNTGQGSLVADMAKGTMRFVTGNIAAGTPENMSIKLPVGTIGIRGTNGVVTVLTQEQAQQQFPAQANQLGGAPGQPIIFAALNGPGPLSNAGSGTGSFNFSTPNGDVDLNRPGAAVLAREGTAPIPFLAPPGSIQQVTNGLRTSGDDDDSGDAGDDQAGGQADGNQATGDQAADDQSGSDTTGTDNAVDESGSGNDVSFNEVTNLENNTAVQNQTNDVATDATAPGSQSVQFSDVFASGTGSISTGTLNISSNGISFTYSSSVSFSSRDMSVSFSNINDSGIGGGMTGGNVGSASVSGSASDLTGPAVFNTEDFTRNSTCAVHCTNIQVQFSTTSTQTVNLGITPQGGSGQTDIAPQTVTLEPN